MLTREVCKLCGRENPLGFSVPDDVWARAVPEPHRSGALCILCFDYFATAAGVEWESEVEFYPVSGSAFAREHGQSLEEVAIRVAPAPRVVRSPGGGKGD